MSEENENRRGRRDEPLHTEKIVTDRKVFFLDLKENDRGRFVKITEDVGGNRDTIMVPAEILGDFIAAIIHHGCFRKKVSPCFPKDIRNDNGRF